MVVLIVMWIGIGMQMRRFYQLSKLVNDRFVSADGKLGKAGPRGGR
jgi:hypothetical protein